MVRKLPNSSIGPSHKRGIELKKPSILEFSTSTEEGCWLQGAYTARLRNDFLWKFHGEELQSECLGKLKLTDMGDRQILIQSESASPVNIVIEGLDEWASHWLEWWRPWSSRDVNSRRIVWSKWTGVPLHAWSRRFFWWGCSSVGRAVELHPLTESKRLLDVAYVRIITGLNSIGGILACKIDGQSFNIRIEEICCVQKEMQLLRPKLDIDSDSDQFFSDDDSGVSPSLADDSFVPDSLRSAEVEMAHGTSHPSRLGPHASSDACLDASNYVKAAHLHASNNDQSLHNSKGMAAHKTSLDLQMGFCGFDSFQPKQPIKRTRGAHSFCTSAGLNKYFPPLGFFSAPSSPTLAPDHFLPTRVFPSTVSLDRIGAGISPYKSLPSDSSLLPSEENTNRSSSLATDGASSKGVECWNFGKKLGLLFPKGDDLAIKTLSELDAAKKGLENPSIPV